MSQTTSPPVIPTSATAPVRRSEGERVRTLQSRFLEVAAQASTHADLLVRIARQLVDVVRADTVVLAKPDPKGGIQLEGLIHPLSGLPEHTSSSFREFAQQAGEERLTRTGRIGRPPTQLLVAVPVLTAASKEVLLALFLAPPAPPDVLTTVIELAVSVLAQFDLRQGAATLDHEVAATAALIDLTGRVQSCQSLSSASQVLCDESASYLQVVQTVVGIVPKGGAGCRLTGTSRSDGAVALDRRETCLEAALDECLLRGEVGIWPPPAGSSRHSLVTHKQLALRWNSPGVVSVPLRTHEGELVGAWIAILRAEDQAARTSGFMQAAAPLLAATLQTIQRGEQGRMARALSGFRHALSQLQGKLIVIGCLALCGLMFVPLPYSVRGQCEVHPVSLKFVAAPFDARLLKAEVEPGDEVTKDQVLARLDGEEIRWELSSVTAEVDRAAKERDGHLAQKDINAAQVSRLEMARMDSKATLLRQRSDQLEIRSPVTGVVISGDLRKAEGAPLTTGQTLFEIAPLEEMVLEIGIPEEDIHHIAVGQHVDAVLSALPDRTWTGTIQRIHPRSELVEQDYVFIAEVEFDNALGLLRPGMKGRAKIETSAHPLGWNLFHKAWEQGRMWLGW